MQLLAVSQAGTLTPARLAERGSNYQCPECGGTVRVRLGRHIRPHYYHPTLPKTCRQSGKSLTHLQVQLYLEALLPAGEMSLEVPFPDIGRIADVVWHSQSLIFEVQCSPISAQEVANRNRDYLAAGYQVIWILHEKYFNARRIRSAEELLWHQPHYFTTINAHGQGYVYDQMSLSSRGLRSYRSPPFAISPTSLVPLDKKAATLVRTKRRSEIWPHCFEGDIAYCETRNLRTSDIQTIKNLEKEEGLVKGATAYGILYKTLSKAIFGYESMFNLVLERMCR
jgi:competence protein CoiA